MSLPRVRLGELRTVLVALAAGLSAAASVGLLPDPWGKVAAVLVATVGGATVWPTTAPIDVPKEPQP